MERTSVERCSSLSLFYRQYDNFCCILYIINVFTHFKLILTMYYILVFLAGDCLFIVSYFSEEREMLYCIFVKCFEIGLD